MSTQHWSSPSHTPTPLFVPEDKQSSSYPVTAPSLSLKCSQSVSQSVSTQPSLSHSILLSLQVIDCHDLGDIITDLIISIMDFFDGQFALSCAGPYILNRLTPKYTEMQGYFLKSYLQCSTIGTRVCVADCWVE